MKKLIGSFLFVGCAISFVAIGCSSGDSGTDAGTDANNMMMDTGMPPMDAAMDVKKDTGPKDAGPMCPNPLPLNGWMPPTFIQPRVPTGACMQADLQGYWDNCRDVMKATMNSCTMWKAAHMTCSSCIESQKTDMQYGPLILDGGITFVNIAGCIAMKGDMACAKAQQNQSLCEQDACDSSCVVTDFFATDHATTLDDWRKCQQIADANGPCKTYANATQSMCAVDSSTVVACTNFMDFKAAFFLIAPMFCSAGG